MTTIATDGKTMAGDGQREFCQTIVDSEAVKVRKLSDGRLYGSCGETAFSELVAAWLEGAEKPDWKPDDGFCALVVTPSGEVYSLSERCHPIKIKAPAAIGSGMDFAIGAMEYGASPKDAVEIARKRDPGTGGTITVLIRDEDRRRYDPPHAVKG